MTIDMLNEGDDFEVKRISVGGEIGKRLVEMGIKKGSFGKLIRRAPLGDPIELKVMNYNISLRKTEAQTVEVEKI